jgi:S1-C subfamily serine protease
MRRARAADNADVYYGWSRHFPVVAAVAALAVAGYALLHVGSSLDHERAARRAEVSKLRQRVDALQARNVAITGRLGSAEQRLKQRDVGIAPLAARVLKSVFTVETDAGLGSGFVAWTDENGSYLITAAHVVEDATGNVTLERKAGSWRGEISAIDHANDLALVRVEGRPAGAEPLWQEPRTAPPTVGDQLLLVGSPFGLMGTVTTGVVSRVNSKVVQTDAAANPGNSGGPALDKHGNIVGVLVSGGGENINFAIRIDRACVKIRDC